MVRDLGRAKQRLAAVQTCLLTWAPHLHSPQCPTRPSTSLRPCVAPSNPSFSPFSHSGHLPSSTKLLNLAPRRCLAWKAVELVSGQAGFSEKSSSLIDSFMYNEDLLKIPLEKCLFNC